MLLLVQPFPPEGEKKKKKKQTRTFRIKPAPGKTAFCYSSWRRRLAESWKGKVSCGPLAAPGSCYHLPSNEGTRQEYAAASSWEHLLCCRGPLMLPTTPARAHHSAAGTKRAKHTVLTTEPPPPHRKTGTHSSQGPPTRAAPRQPCVPFRAQFASVRVPESTHLKVSFLPQHLLILSTEIKKAPKKKKSTRAGNFMLRLPQQQFHGPTCGINHSIPNASKASQGRERLPCVMT